MSRFTVVATLLVGRIVSTHLNELGDVETSWIVDRKLTCRSDEFLDSSSCVTECDSGFYYSDASTNRVCASQPCALFQSIDHCVDRCADGHLPREFINQTHCLPESLCPSVLDGFCVDSCPPGTKRDSTNPKHCFTECPSSHIARDALCIPCRDHLGYLLDSQEITCIPIAECDSDTGFAEYQGRCVNCTQLGMDLVRSRTGHICTESSTICDEHGYGLFNNTCLSCQSLGYQLIKGRCQETTTSTSTCPCGGCAARYTFNNDLNHCVPQCDKLILNSTLHLATGTCECVSASQVVRKSSRTDACVSPSCLAGRILVDNLEIRYPDLLDQEAVAGLYWCPEGMVPVARVLAQCDSGQLGFKVTELDLKAIPIPGLSDFVQFEGPEYGGAKLCGRILDDGEGSIDLDDFIAQAMGYLSDFQGVALGLLARYGTKNTTRAFFKNMNKIAIVPLHILEYVSGVESVALFGALDYIKLSSRAGQWLNPELKMKVSEMATYMDEGLVGARFERDGLEVRTMALDKDLNVNVTENVTISVPNRSSCDAGSVLVGVASWSTTAHAVYPRCGVDSGIVYEILVHDLSDLPSGRAWSGCYEAGCVYVADTSDSLTCRCDGPSILSPYQVYTEFHEWPSEEETYVVDDRGNSSVGGLVIIIAFIATFAPLNYL